MEKIIYKPISGYENNYTISNTGTIKNIIRNTILKPTLRKEYLGVSLCKSNVKKTYNVHRLVAITFIENPENKPQVNHLDGNKFNNNAWNLEWSTSSENIQHAYDNGLNKFSDYAILKLKERFCKKIIDVETGIIYLSINEAAQLNDLNNKTLSSKLSGRTKNNTNLQYLKITGELPD